MESEENKRIIFKSNEKMFQIYSSFMERIAKFEELVTIGSRLLTGFQQGLEFIRRPPIEKSSKLIEQIIKANETKRLSSYIEAGGVNVHDSVHNITKFNTCHSGLIDHLNKGKDIVDELELLLQNAETEVEAETTDNLYNLQLEHDNEELLSSCCKKSDATDYAVMMAIIYSMVKKDYTMQERIVSSLSMKSSSGELESYCMMWSLRPFVEDEMMHKAWKLIP